MGGITKGGGGTPGWHSVDDPWPSIERARKLGTSDRERRRRAYSCISAGCAVMAEFVTCRSPVPGHNPHGTLLPWAVLCFDPVSGCPSVSKENIRLYPIHTFDSSLTTHAALASDCHAVHSWAQPTIDVPSLAARRQRASYTAKPSCSVLF